MAVVFATAFLLFYNVVGLKYLPNNLLVITIIKPMLRYVFYTYKCNNMKAFPVLFIFLLIVFIAFFTVFTAMFLK